MSAHSSPADARLIGHTGRDVSVQILHVPGCPLVGNLRSLLERCLSRSGLSVTVEEVEGGYPSPTLLINGADVTGGHVGTGPSCRLDLPAEEQILAALTRADALVPAETPRPNKSSK
jgi:hypothetical protein